MVTAVTWTAFPCMVNVIMLITPNKARKSPKMLTNCASHSVRNARCFRMVFREYWGAAAAGVAIVFLAYLKLTFRASGRLGLLSGLPEIDRFAAKRLGKKAKEMCEQAGNTI